MHKQEKYGKSNTQQPPPTPQPWQRTAKPKSSKDKPTSAPLEPTDPAASQKKIITISAKINVSKITTRNQKRQLGITKKYITTIMKAIILKVVKSSLNANQRLILVFITGIDGFSIDGLLGTTIDSQFMLTGNCARKNCKAQLLKTTMSSTVILFMTQEINNGNYNKIFQENADAKCAKPTCQDKINGRVVGGTFNETKRGQVGVPTEEPLANRTTLMPTSKPTSLSQTSAAPTKVFPTKKSPTSDLTEAPSAAPPNPTSSKQTTVSQSVAPSTFPTAIPKCKPATACPTCSAPTNKLPTTTSPSSVPTQPPLAIPTTMNPTSQPTTASQTSAALTPYCPPCCLPPQFQQKILRQMLQH